LVREKLGLEGADVLGLAGKAIPKKIHGKLRALSVTTA